MSTDHSSKHNKSDEIYFKVWDKSQKSVRQRLFVTVFLLTASLALFSYSLHSQNLTNPAIKEFPNRFSVRRSLYCFGWFYTLLVLILLLWIIF